MFMEAFHRVVKILYLHHKQNRIIDNLLTVLLKITRDKTFERFQKVEMGKSTHRICEIRKRHRVTRICLHSSFHCKFEIVLTSCDKVFLIYCALTTSLKNNVTYQKNVNAR